MEMQTSSSFLQAFGLIICVWGVLCLFALALISLRRDKHFVYEDINKLIMKPNVYLQVVSMLLLYIILPISIPFSLSHIIKK